MLMVGQGRVPRMGSCSVWPPEQPCRAWGLLAAWKGNSLLGSCEKSLEGAVGGMLHLLFSAGFADFGG